MSANDSPIDTIRTHGLRYIHRGDMPAQQVFAQLADDLLNSEPDTASNNLLRVMDRLRMDVVMLTRFSSDPTYRDLAVRRCAELAALLTRKLQQKKGLLDVRAAGGEA